MTLPVASFKVKKQMLFRIVNGKGMYFVDQFPDNMAFA